MTPIPPSDPATPEPLARQLSGLGVWLLVINGIIGAGIFGMPSEAARLAGGFSPWVFVICAVLMLPVMLCFAELASHFDGTGGPVRYVGSVFGPFAGFQAGWAFYVARLTAFSANAALLVGAVGYFWPAADDPRMRLVLLLLVCGGLTALTVTGTRRAMRSLGAVTVLKLAAAGSFVWLASLSVLTRVLIFVGCIAALPALRRRPAQSVQVLRLPGGLLIPGIAVLICRDSVHAGLLAGGQFGLQCPRDRRGHFALDGKDVLGREFAIIGLGPKVGVGPGVDNSSLARS